MTSQRFCLRWNNHQSNLLSVFDQLLHDESFVDVTLAVDGRYLKAHKIVLSACSPYFQALFVGHPDRHPIVILKDIPYVDMRSLLDFMYRGEVSVDQDRLTTFLKVAESLRIKGLTEVNEDQCDLPKMASSLLSNPDHLNSPLSAGSISLSYRQRLKRHMSGSQHGLNTSLQTNNPLLGSALTGPKRKRGLPRKLSGSLSAGLDVMPDGDEEEEGGGMCEEEVEEEYDEERSVASDSDMIERSDSPFDNKMLEVNMSEAKPPQPHRRPSSEDESSVCNMEERGEGGRSPSPGREEEGGAAGDKPLSASQELVSNVKAERDTEGNSGGDQTERTSPTPERFPPGKKRPFPHRRDVSVSKRKHHQTLSKSITYDLNPDVSLTRGIIYAEHSGDECEIISVAKRVNAGRPMRRSKRVRLANAQDSDIMAADVVECEAEDVLRSLTKLTPGALESNGYCEETGVFGSGVHFLTSESLLSFIQATDTDTSNSSSTFPSPNFPSTNLSTNFPSFGEDDVLTRKDLLEYLMNSDGTCACKLCGEVLTSRTHWYRHKYKVHTPAHLAPPVSESKLPDLHSCAECKQYFKSKKGYLGHLQAKHNIDCDETTHAQTDTPSSESSTQALNTISVGDTRETRIGESRPSGIVGQTRMSSILVEKDYAKQRELEEKLVKDIIDKVKRECEAQGDNAMSRKGYTKKMRK